MRLAGMNIQENRALISVILPTKNRRALLPMSIESVFNQTYPNLELLVIDDGSRDGTWEYLSELSFKTSRLVASRQNRSIGLAGALNLGIKKACGDFVFISGDRMILKSDCIERLHYSFTTLTRAGHIVGAIAPRFGDSGFPPPKSFVRPSDGVVELGRITGEIYHDFSKTTSGLSKVPALHAYALFPRNAVLGIGGFWDKLRGSNWRIESDLYFRLRRAGYELFYEPQAVLHPRIASTGGSRVGRLQNDYFLLLNHAIYLARNYGARSAYMILAYTLMSIIPKRARPKF